MGVPNMVLIVFVHRPVTGRVVTGQEFVARWPITLYGNGGHGVIGLWIAAGLVVLGASR
jgi:hypothetical protein